jgi:hypothetical protein
MSSWSGWMVATMSRIGPDLGRSISAMSSWLVFFSSERARPSPGPAVAVKISSS